MQAFAAPRTDGMWDEVRHEIRKIFLVSDNEAFNRLYELVGPDGIAASLARAGITDLIRNRVESL